MKKTNLFIGLSCSLAGIGLLIAGSISQSSLLPALGRLGFSITFIGLCNLITWNEWRKGADSAYAQALRQTEIEQQDERNLLLRDRSAYLALRMLFVLLLMAHSVFLLLDLLGRWQPFSRCLSLFCLLLCMLLWMFQGIIRSMLNSRM